MPAEVYPVPVMARGEAVSLLEEWAQGSLAATDEQIKDEIVRQLAYLPLAVRLAGAQLRDKAPEAWLKTFDARKIKAKRVESTHDSLELTFGLSLDALPAELRQRYVALAIFREDEPAPFATIARLWATLAGVDAEPASDNLDDLVARAAKPHER